jgi:hypothetical protein
MISIGWFIFIAIHFILVFVRHPADDSKDSLRFDYLRSKTQEQIIVVNSPQRSIALYLDNENSGGRSRYAMSILQQACQKLTD